MKYAVWLLLAACNEDHLTYDPMGSWAPMSPDAWASDESYEHDLNKCTGETFDLLTTETIELSGTFPAWNGRETEGEAAVGDVVIPLTYTHDRIDAAGAYPPAYEFPMPGGDSVHLFEFGADRQMGVWVDQGPRTCWYWFEQLP